MKNSKKRNANLQRKAERERIRRRNKKIIITVSIIAAAVLFLAIYIAKMPDKVTFKKTDDGFLDQKTGITYTFVTPYVYEPKRVYSDEEFVYGTMDGDEVYEIEGADTKKWLARKLPTGVITVYCATDITPPELNEFEADSVTVYEEDVFAIEIASITDKNDVSEVVSEYCGGNEVSKPDNVKKVYNLRFSSEKYPFLYYCVQFVEAEDGYYYCSHDNGKYYTASDIISDVLNGD